LKGGDGCALSYAAGKAIAIVPNEKIYEFVFLFLFVFIGFFSGRFAVPSHTNSDEDMPVQG